MKRANWVVYGLADPRDGVIHYIGSTCDLQRRAAQHRQRTGLRSLALAEWFRELRKARVPFSVVILESVSRSMAEARELGWIEKGKWEGWPLANSRGVVVRKTPGTVMLPPSLWEELSVIARGEGISRNALIERFILAGIEEYERRTGTGFRSDATQQPGAFVQ